MTQVDNDSAIEVERFRQRLQLARDDNRRVEVILGFLDALVSEHPELAIVYATDAHRMASQLGLTTAAADVLRHRGNARIKVGEADAGASDLEEAFEMVTHLSSIAPDAELAQTATTIALTLGERSNASGDAAGALQWYMSALDACERVDNRAARIKVFESLGHLYSGLGDYTRALEHHFECLALLGDDADRDAVGVTFAAIGTTYALSGDYDEAFNYVTRALTEFRACDNRYLEVGALSNLSSILYSQNELTTALEYALTTVTIYEALDDHLHTAASLVTVGKIYERQGELDAALHCYLRAMRALGNNVDERLHVSILAS
ncbi:MAG: tetratricopeptide repeat protein, partial [bacterium]|nr:tetratricopeptide repeat protein [Candidatus Kapabacteria bacterium]